MRLEPSSGHEPTGIRVSPSLASATPAAPAFRTVVIDVEAAAPHLECFDWLARRRGDIVQRRVADLADLPVLADVGGARPNAAHDHGAAYRERLALIRPRRADLDALAAAYVAEVPAEATAAVRRLKREGVRVVLVTTGLRYALLRLGARLELDLADIHGVDIKFDAVGAYVGFDAKSPLARTGGKDAALAGLDLDLPTLVPQSFAQLAALALV